MSYRDVAAERAAKVNPPYPSDGDCWDARARQCEDTIERRAAEGIAAIVRWQVAVDKKRAEAYARVARGEPPFQDCDSTSPIPEKS